MALDKVNQNHEIKKIKIKKEDDLKPITPIKEKHAPAKVPNKPLIVKTDKYAPDLPKEEPIKPPIVNDRAITITI